MNELDLVGGSEVHTGNRTGVKRRGGWPGVVGVGVADGVLVCVFFKHYDRDVDEDRTRDLRALHHDLEYRMKEMRGHVTATQREDGSGGTVTLPETCSVYVDRVRSRVLRRRARPGSPGSPEG